MTAQEQFIADRSVTKTFNAWRSGLITPAMAARVVLPMNLVKRHALASTIKAPSNDVDLNGAITNAVAGTTFDFAGASYGSPITLKSNTSYRGKVTVTTDTKSFALLVPSGAQNIDLDIELVCNCGGILLQGPASDCIFDGFWTFGGNGTYYNRVGLRGTNLTRIKLRGRGHTDHNKGDRTFDIYNTQDCEVDVEQINVNDGGHFDGTHNNLNFIHWRVQNVKRMGLELQDQGSSGGSNITLNGPQIIDHVTPYNESFGLSLMPQRHKNVRVLNAYCRAGTNPVVSGSHKGYGIEIGAGDGSVVDGAIVGGDYVAGFACAMKVPIKNTKVFGAQQWGAYSSEPGLNGNGTVIIDSTDQQGLPLNQMPSPDAVSGGGTTTPTMNLAITNITADGFTGTITNAPAGATSGNLYLKTKDGKNSIGNPIPISSPTFTIIGAPEKWEVLASVNFGTGSATANVFQLLGTTAAKYPDALSMQPAVKGTVTPPPGVSHFVEHREFDFDGKAISNDTGLKTTVTAK